MKKTLIALMTLGSVAMAATTTVMDVTENLTSIENNVTYTAPTTGTTGSFAGDGIYAGGGGGVAHAALTFVLDLTKLNALTAQTNVATFDEAYDTGLIWGRYNDTWGLMGNWQGGTWHNNGGCFASIETLMNSAFTVNDTEDKFITLTLTTANTSGAQGGVQLYVAGSSTSLFTNSVKLGSGSNTSISAVTFDTSLIQAAAVTSGWVPGDNASTLGANLKTDFVAAHVPEPATATLSLLALAGLAARRRRH